MSQLHGTGARIISERVLLDLDVILDTRLPFLYKLYSNSLKEAGALQAYVSRDRDIPSFFLEGVPESKDALFKASYENRSVEDITSNSGPTKILSLLEQELQNATTSISDSPYKYSYSFTLNVYPYELNDKEKKEFIAGIRYWLMPYDIDIDVISVSNEWLTMEYLHENFNRWITYDFESWTNVQINSIQRFPCPQFNVVAPIRVLDGRKIKPKDLESQTAQIVSGMAGALKLSMLPLSVFSLDLDLFKDSKENKSSPNG